MGLFQERKPDTQPAQKPPGEEGEGGLRKTTDQSNEDESANDAETDTAALAGHTREVTEGRHR